MDNSKIKIISWKDVRKDLVKVNPLAVEVIDAVDPGKDLPLLKVSYAYGEKILEDGRLSLLDQVEDNARLLDLISYSTVPLGLFLNKTSEAFIEMNDRVIPVFMLEAGNTIGLFETLNILNGSKSNYLWEVRAGARSIFMLAKINNALWHKRLLRQFSISTETPKTLTDQWEVFVDLANSANADVDWHCDMIFFTKSWIDHLRKDQSFGWTRFREYLYWKCWMISSDLLDKSFSTIWQQFSSSTITRNYKPRIYITDTIRHLISIGFGLITGFAPAIDESAAPVKFLKQAYHEVYDLPHAPTIMLPAFASEDGVPVYYSLNYPNLLEGHPETNNIYNTISDLKEIKMLLQNMQYYCQKKLPTNNKFAYAIQQIQFDYYHKILDKHADVKEASKIVEADQNFLEFAPGLQGKNFCSSAPFLSGCIQITRKK